MHVHKRNGALEPVDVNKIVRAVQRCYYASPLSRGAGEQGDQSLRNGGMCENSFAKRGVRHPA